MITHQDIIAAKQLLNLPERASMEEIKASYRRLIHRWHPDKCRDDESRCHEMSSRIIEAYKTIMVYCNQYKYSFADEEIRQYMSDEEWWMDRFGSDPIWGAGSTS